MCAVGLLASASCDTQPSVDSPLWDAVVAQDVAAVRRLLEAGADPNAAPNWVPVISRAGRHGDPEIVRALLEAGANPDVRYALIWPPLAQAVYQKNMAAVEAFLEGGAGVDFRGGAGQTPLLWAAGFEGGTGIAAMLLEAGADVNAVESLYHHTPLIAAACDGDLEMVRLLLDAGADTGAIAKDDQNALELAEANGHKEVAELLRSVRTVP